MPPEPGPSLGAVRPRHYPACAAAGQAVARQDAPGACAPRSWCRSRAGGSRGSSASARPGRAVPGLLTAACAGGLYTGPPSSSLFLSLSDRRDFSTTESSLSGREQCQQRTEEPCATGRHRRAWPQGPAAQGVAKEGKVHGVDVGAAPNGRGLEEEEQKSR